KVAGLGSAHTSKAATQSATQATDATDATDAAETAEASKAADASQTAKTAHADQRGVVILERRAGSAEGKRATQHLQVLIQRRLVHAVGNRDDQVGHLIRPHSLFLDRFLRGGDFDVVGSHQVGAA